MGRFRVLIVDDEVNIAKGLALLIQRFMPECDVIALAHDGEQGFHQVMKLCPDIVLTDIRMPKMDGIEMIRHLKADESPARFIILSGYAEFEYAKRAISLGVEGYIIKPVEEEELCAVFRKVCASLEEDKRQMKQILAYGLKEILEASGERTADVRSRLAALDFPMEEDRYLCTIWETDGAISQESIISGLRTGAEKCLDFCQAVIAVPFTKTTTAILLAFDKSRERIIKQSVANMKMLVSERLKTEMSVGTGVCCNRAEKICGSFEEARCALNYKVVKGSGCLIYYEKIRNLQSNQELVDIQDVKQLESYIDSMDDAGCRCVVNQIFHKIEQAGNVSLTDLQTLSLNLVLTGIRKIPFMQFQLNSYLGSNILSLESISRFQTVEQLKNWIVNMLKSMNELMLKENLPERRDVVAEIKEYIGQNYNKEISLHDIAEQFYINPYYLSQLFKKRTGETYQKYLTGIRLNRAKKLLEETDLKLYEISNLVGYTDSTYFSKVFERYVGMKPIEYRDRRL